MHGFPTDHNLHWSQKETKGQLICGGNRIIVDFIYSRNLKKMMCWNPKYRKILIKFIKRLVNQIESVEHKTATSYLLNLMT